MSDLARKLGLTPDRTVCLLDAPPDAVEIVRAACPPGVALVVGDSGPEGPAYKPNRERSGETFTSGTRTPVVHDRASPTHSHEELPRYDLILYWPRTRDGLAERLSRLQGRITPDGALWVVMPKKAHARVRGIAFTWEEMQTAALRTDLVDNKIATFSESDYATRFVIRKERRGAYT